MNSDPTGKSTFTLSTTRFLLRGLLLALVVLASLPTRAAWLEEEIPVTAITVTASSEFGGSQSARHLVDGSGLQNGLHDNDGSAKTMWHTIQAPPATSAATGLPASPAWVRFDFSQPRHFDSIYIWNHNQPNLTDRGFRKTRIFGSADGATWFAVTSPEVIELPRAAGSPGLEPYVVANADKTRELKSVVIAAETQDGNYGGDYYGLS